MIVEVDRGYRLSILSLGGKSESENQGGVNVKNLGFCHYSRKLDIKGFRSFA